jgi:hypothetical protein
MQSIENLMIELDGADPETVNRIAWEKGSLPVRLAMLGLASIRKGDRPLWWGYPPGVFISYKWDGAPIHDLVVDLAKHVRELGYRAFLDVENLDENADAYFQIPQFITSIQDCTFYILLLTELSADLMTGRKGKTTWIHDEFQHAVRLANSGRLIIVPVLLEPKGTTDDFTLNNVIDLTGNQREFSALHDILRPDPIVLNKGETEELTTTVAEFDKTFLNERWKESDGVLRCTQHLGHTFDHQFRRMLHSMYTANRPGLDAALAQLHAIYGEQIVWHLYKGYCTKHRIPNLATMEQQPA